VAQKASQVAQALRRLRHLPVREWPEVAATVAAATCVEAGLRALRLPALARMVGTPLAETTDDGPAPVLALDALPPYARHRLAVCVRVMKHWPFDEKCLRRSLVSGWRIRRLNPRLAIGVALVDGQVQAHAWLMVDGASLDPWGASAFKMLKPVPT